MNLSVPKRLRFFSVAILVIGTIAVSCNKKTIPPYTTYTRSKTNDTTAAAKDSLPAFDSPAGVAVDAAGNVYVADYGNNVIRKITSTGLVSTFAGSGIQGSVDATGVLASFNKPGGVAVDANGNVYVADAGNNRIRKITASGLVTTLAGRDTTGFLNGPVTSATFFYPTGVSVDNSGNLYVADAGNNLVRLISSSGNVSTLAGNPADTSRGGLLNNPTGIAVDVAGNVFVAGYLNNNIIKISSTGVASTYAGTGAPGSNNGPVTAATFYYPSGLAVDANGNIFVADQVNNVIREITPGGTVSTFAGSGVAGATDGPAATASFNGPAGVAVDAAGYVYVADADNNVVRKITPAGTVSTLAGSGLPGYKNGQASVIKSRLNVKYLYKKPNIFIKPKILL